MEELKDLNLMVSEAKRMTNTFRAFEKLPKILQVLQSSDKFLKELDERKTNTEKELADLLNKVDGMTHRIDTVNKTIRDQQFKLDHLKDGVAEEKKTLMAEMMEVVEDKVAEEKLLLNVDLDKLRAKIAQDKTAVAQSRVVTADTIKTHKREMEKYAALEADYHTRAKDAKKSLDEMRETLFGGAS